MSNKYFWCIGGGILQIPVIRSAKELGFKVLVTDGSENCLAAKEADIFHKVSIFDIKGHLELAKSLISLIDFSGVLAAGIDAPITMSVLCEYLSLPGVKSEISKIVHDKYKFREFSRKNNIPTPKYRIFGEKEIDKLPDYLKNHPLPFIIKNVDSSGSRGTKIFFKRNEIEEFNIAREAIKVSKSNSFLVESVWIGKECTVETLFDINGKFHPCFITDRIFDYKSGVPLEKGLVNPSRLPIKTQEDCFELSKKVADLLGIKIGAAKFDMIITEDGPRIIEMTTRLSGGFDCQYLVPAASGKNVVKAAVMTACGMNFQSELLENRLNRVAVTGSHWPKNGKIIRIENLAKVRKTDGVEHIFLRKDVGSIINNYSDCTDRVSFAICSGKSYEEAKSKLEFALSNINFEISNE